MHLQKFWLYRQTETGVSLESVQDVLKLPLKTLDLTYIAIRKSIVSENFTLTRIMYTCCLS